MANPTPDTTTTDPATTVAADTTAVQQQSTTAADTPATQLATPAAETAPVDTSVGALPVTTVEPVQQVKPDPGIIVVDGQQTAQVVGTPFQPKTTVDVAETHVVTDKVILDTSDPLAVQPGPSTPYPLTIGAGKTPEQQFESSRNAD